MKEIEEETAYCDWCNKPFNKSQLKFGFLKINDRRKMYKFCPKCFRMIKDKNPGLQD